MKTTTLVRRVAIISLLFFSSPVLGSDLVILLSWDGMRHDFPDKANHGALQKMATDGVRAKLIPTTPSNTFPGHVTLATGAPPTTHGILDNTMRDRTRGDYRYGADANWINAEPLWIAVERQGKKAATYFWVGSETDWRGKRHSYRMAPFDESREESEKVAKIIEWIDLPEPERPSLIAAYWRGADRVAHLKGPDHPDVAEAIRAQDIQLQILMYAIAARGLWDSTTMIVTSDHGMTVATQNIPVAEPLAAAGIKAKVVGGPTVKRIFLEDAGQRAAAVKVLSGIAHIDVHTGEGIPAELRFPQRTGDIVVTVRLPYALGQDNSFRGKLRRLLQPVTGWRSGAHGYDPAHPDMAAMFLAYGAGVTKGKSIPPVNQDQVAATVTALLGLEPPLDAQGEAVSLGD